MYHDQDGDGLLNDEEILIGTNPILKCLNQDLQDFRIYRMFYYFIT
ncbi:thrombospondin type 3 repeat-containing protein [Candidatus Marithrix sp. Canyon 246]